MFFFFRIENKIMIIKLYLLIESFLFSFVIGWSLFVDDVILEFMTSSASSVLKFSIALPFDFVDLTDAWAAWRIGEEIFFLWWWWWWCLCLCWVLLVVVLSIDGVWVGSWILFVALANLAAAI